MLLNRTDREAIRKAPARLLARKVRPDNGDECCNLHSQRSEYGGRRHVNSSRFLSAHRHHDYPNGLGIQACDYHVHRGRADNAV